MGEVHCWRVDLDVTPATAAGLHATLTCDERDRSERLRFERDQRRFVVARGALRGVLGRYVDTPPDQIRFAYNAFGKPELSSEFGSRLKFNLSHSADLALIAVAADAAVGVDVERVREGNYADVARYLFSPAEVGLGAEAFFSCWTKREAYVKARGEGLAHRPVVFGDGWSFFPLEPAPGYVGAVAVEGNGWRLKEYVYTGTPSPSVVSIS